MLPVRGILIAAGVALTVSILLTPYLIRFFARQGFGQEIRTDGPATHQAKRGTPTMGGVAIIIAIWLGYLVAHVSTGESGGSPTASAWLVLLLTTALGAVGFLDDLIKLRRQRNLGLSKTSKLTGQLITAVIFAVLALRFANAHNLTPVSVRPSFVRDILVLSFGAVGFVLFCYLLVSAWSNAVNLTDGLDGLAAGTSAMVLFTYVIIGFWQFRNSCALSAAAGCYQGRDPLDVALVAAAVADEIRGLGRRALAVGGDLADPAVAERMADEFRDSFGRLDCFVANAGIWPPDEVALGALSLERWRATMAANLDAVFLSTRAALGLMGPGGRVVIVSSTAGQRGEAHHSDYAATKGAVIALVKSLAVEYAPDILVNGVAPGWVDTDMCVPAFEGEGRERVRRTIPLGRIPPAEDIAGPILFLCSELARHVTGEILNVNGGSVLCG